MKKILISMFLLFSTLSFLSFSRFIEQCEITSKGTYRNGVGYVNCVSLESGRHFNFTRVNYRTSRRSLQALFQWTRIQKFIFNIIRISILIKMKV